MLDNVKTAGPRVDDQPRQQGPGPLGGRRAQGVHPLDQRHLFTHPVTSPPPPAASFPPTSASNRS